MHINTNHNSGSSLFGNALYLALPITREPEQQKKAAGKKCEKIQSVEGERITHTTEREIKKKKKNDPQRNFIVEQQPQQKKREFRCREHAYFNTFNLFAPFLP